MSPVYSYSEDAPEATEPVVTEEMEQFKRRIHQLEQELSQVRADYRALLEKHQQLISDNGWAATADWARRSGGTM